MWLNEGLATFFESYASEAVYDKSFVWQRFYTEKREKAMYEDGMGLTLFQKQTVPSEEEIKKPEEAEKLFSWNLYERGACMLAMVRSILGEKTFLSTTTEYLKNNSFSSTVSRNLFAHWFHPAKNEIEAISQSTVTLEHFYDFMEPWTNRSGYPVVYLARHETDNTVSKSLIIKAFGLSPKYHFLISINFS